jgi:hypothetical protein
MTNIQVATHEDLAHVRRLFRECAAGVGMDLSLRDSDRKREKLPGDYVGPGGVLLVARWREKWRAAWRPVRGVTAPAR